MKVLITGGAGFIGSEITRKLSAMGVPVVIYDIFSAQIHGSSVNTMASEQYPLVSVIKGDICDSVGVKSALDSVTHVIHLAAETGTGQSMYEISQYCNVNTQGTAVLMSCLMDLRGGGVERIVLASSRSIYGEGAYFCKRCNVRTSPPPRSRKQLESGDWEMRCGSAGCGTILDLVRTREDDPKNPASVYAATKLAQEDLVRICAASLDIDYAALRFQNVYGEGQSLTNPYTGILSIFSTRIRRGLPLGIFEDGNESRDFVHVSDVADAVIAATLTKSELNAPFNIGSGKGTSVSDIATMLLDLFGCSERGFKITGQYRVGDIRHNIADITAARNSFGFQPTMPLDQGLSKFVDWVQSQPIPQDRLEEANQELIERNLMQK